MLKLNLNDKLTNLFIEYMQQVRATSEYKTYYDQIVTELTTRASKGNLTAYRVSNVPDSVRDALSRDFAAQGLRVCEINGHELEVSIKLPA